MLSVHRYPMQDADNRRADSQICFEHGYNRGKVALIDLVDKDSDLSGPKIWAFMRRSGKKMLNLG